ncbi:MAG: 4a-hydroxytetrahydrobiopterin dehydratase [Magnetococcales bacterium]|nr:4a-hydroxytetrahydrobiopterin dehydratase [Magnetococcales bacterium]
MTHLHDRHCRRYEGYDPALDVDQARTLLKETPEWVLGSDGLEISRLFWFEGYDKTLAFVNAVAGIAIQEDHHPEMVFSYDRCRVRWATTAVAALTENDFICAAKINRMLGEMPCEGGG